MPFLSPVLPVQQAQGQGIIFWEALSRLIGWAYVVAWTISFWPQAILIYKRKSVAGISLDFLTLNFFGFLCYSIFNLGFLISPVIQQQYSNSHNGEKNLVRWNDAAFAIHAFLIATWTYLSTFYYKRAPGQHAAMWSKILLALLVATLTAALAVCIIGGGDDDSIIRWLDFVNICSYIKLVITLVKYSIIMNYKRKSTRGFAILGITLDAMGGGLSLVQLFIDAQIINHDWSGVTGDPGKLGLSLISMAFDAVLITQHYVMYGDVAVEGEEEADPDVESPDEERRPLLS